MARPKKPIDEETVEKLAAIHCSYNEMALILNCNPSTLTRRFAQAIEKGRAHGKQSLKRKQYEVAMSGNVTMLIWLGKIILDQRDKSDPKVIVNNIHSEPDAKLDQRLEELLPKVKIV
jgi:hypothetical protein